MKIQSLYLDKRQATEKALRDYPRMSFLFKAGEADLKRAAGRTGLPRESGRHAAPEDTEPGRWVLKDMEQMKESYEQAAEYMAWFTPRWKELSEEERYVLETFYANPHEYGAYAADRIAERFMIDRSSAYRRKNRALDHLTVLLYGRF